MNFLRYLLIGCAVGMANVIPGVSGGTVAVVFNIYDKFVNALTFNVKKLIQERKFLIPLVSGMLLGVVLFSKLITILYENFPLQTNFFFTGLILGSIPLLVSYVFKRENDEQLKKSTIVGSVICILAGIAFMILYAFLEAKFGLNEGSSSLSEELPPWTIKLALRIFIAGILGAIAMIIPGISGSLLMLMMGVYPIVVKCIPLLFVPSEFLKALCLLLPNGIGVLIGLACGVALIKFLLRKVKNQTYAVILGLLVGSAFNLFPGFKDVNGAGNLLICILCLIFGVLLAYLGSRLAPEENSGN